MPKTFPRDTFKDVVDDVLLRLGQCERICTTSRQGKLADTHGVALDRLRSRVVTCISHVLLVAVEDELPT